MQSTEAEWQQTVIEAAQAYGWMVAHFRPAKTEKGWRTPVAADGKGFPDLVLVKAGRGGGVLFRELKSESGETTSEQATWLSELSDAGADAGVWRPSDWPEVQRRLRGEVPGTA